MYPEHKNQGDHSAAAMELLSGIPETEQKCLAVEKAVKEGYFTLHDALAAYEVSEIEYFSYIMSRYSNQLKKADKQEQLHETLVAMSMVFFDEDKGADFSYKKMLDLISNGSLISNSSNSVFEKILSR